MCIELTHIRVELKHLLDVRIGFIALPHFLKAQTAVVPK